MVTTVTAYTDSRNRAYGIDGYGGVVRVSAGGNYGSGALLYDGRAILTAAHLFHSAATESATIHFETASGNQTLTSSRITVLSSYDASNSNNDLALVWLSSAAPTSANRYTPYRGSDEIGQTLTMAGYGSVGSGNSGTLSSYTGSPLRLKADNQFDADAVTLKNTLGAGMAWSPATGTQLIADFDDGTLAHDALGQLMNLSGRGLGQDEGLTAPGDSGGPAFINGQLAGVASYIAQLSRNSDHPDIDDVSNSSFGEIGFWQRVSHYQQWIDQSLRAQYPNAPRTAEEVEKAVSESNSGTRYAYFLLQFTGVRSTPDQPLSVDYSTRDNTARAGEDYLAASGTLVLYPDESQAVIPVEIIGDTTPEFDETFYLDVTNPVGGSFGEGIIKLTAVRTILNDDF